MFTVWIHIENIQAFLGGGGTNPFEKYARQLDHFPNFRGEK